jgi:hypothetical protein
MKLFLTIVTLIAALGGCAIVPLDRGYRSDGYSRSSDEYYRGDGYYRGNGQDYYYRGDRYTRGDRFYRQSPFAEHGN